MNLVNRPKLALWTVIFLLILSRVSSLAQGGTGRENPAPPKKATTRNSAAPHKKPSAVKPSSEPPFQPQNPNIALVQVEPGSFTMGTNDGKADERPAHQVSINYSFYIGKYEVTNAQWHSVMGSYTSYPPGCDNCPVVDVTWDDAQRFIAELNKMNDGFRYRLPTEAEWEYACRAGTGGDYEGELDSIGWYITNAGNKTHSVGSKRPNAWGLFDMHGNVWEWCEDWYHESYDGAPSDGTAWLTPITTYTRVVRGGSYFTDAGSARSANRHADSPGYRYGDLGFRLVAVR